MKKVMILVVLMLLLQAIAVSADAADAKQAWKDAKEHTRELRTIHQHAKVDFAADKSEENKQKVVDTGKDMLHAALDEADAWLDWKELETQENKDVPDEIRDNIESDIEANRAKIEALRTDVDNVQNPLALGLTALKIIGKHVELFTDVARNSGMIWVHVGREKIATIEEYEQKLRDVGDEDADVYLDNAKKELDKAKENLDDAEAAYNQVKLPGTPLIKFSEGNNYLRAARMNLLAAHKSLNDAFREIAR